MVSKLCPKFRFISPRIAGVNSVLPVAQTWTDVKHTMDEIANSFAAGYGQRFPGEQHGALDDSGRRSSDHASLRNALIECGRLRPDANRARGNLRRFLLRTGAWLVKNCSHFYLRRFFSSPIPLNAPRVAVTKREMGVALSLPPREKGAGAPFPISSRSCRWRSPQTE